MSYTCPVCDYPHLRHKPYEVWPPPAGVDLDPPYEQQLGAPSYDVCPLCAYEFGNDDNPGTARPVSFAEYRASWVADGRRPFMDGKYLVAGFDPQRHGTPAREIGPGA